MWYSIAWILLASVSYAAGTDYCSFTKEHTLCKYADGKVATKCGTPVERGLKEEEKKEIVQIHNDLRSKVAQGNEQRPESRGGTPSASNMREMEWDDELATEAQTWADQCIFDHDCNDCRKTSTFSSVGQNIFQGAASLNYWDYIDYLKTYEGKTGIPSRWKEAVTSWYDEVKDMDPKLISSFGSSPYGVVGHYTQVVWADTYKVGCGYIEYLDGAMYTRNMVCNYAPGGNLLTARIYKDGKDACSECPTGTSCSKTSPGLCAASESTDEGDASKETEEKTDEKEPSDETKQKNDDKKCKEKKKKCKKLKKKGKCGQENIQQMCPKSCGKC